MKIINPIHSANSPSFLAQRNQSKLKKEKRKKAAPNAERGYLGKKLRACLVGDFF
jgi:hypothetical protein